MNYLITGGTGFLGSHIAKKLDSIDDRVIIPTTKIRANTSLHLQGFFDSGTPTNIKVIEGDIRDFEFLRKLFNEYEFDYVFHLAAISEVRKCQADPRLAYQVNVEGTVNILEACRLYAKPKKIIVSSSDKAYGTSLKLPYSESHPLRGKAVYESTKTCADVIAQNYGNNFGMPVVVTRCCNLYGPFDTNISRIIPNTIIRALQGNNAMVYSGMKKARREFIYVDDAADAYVKLSHHNEGSPGAVAYNIGSGQVFTIQDVAEQILLAINPALDIDSPESGFPEIMEQVLDSSKIEGSVGWKAKTQFADGLDETIRAYSILPSKLI